MTFPFLDLPLEMRDLIYAYALLPPDCNLIHLALKDTGATTGSRRLLTRRCSAEAPDECTDKTLTTIISRDPESPSNDTHPLVYNIDTGKQIPQDIAWCPLRRAHELPNDPRPSITAFSLALTCKCIYHETKTIVFSNVIWSSCDVAAFISLREMVASEQWTALRHVQLDCEWFEPGWDNQRYPRIELTAAVPNDRSQNNDLMNAKRWYQSQQRYLDQWTNFWQGLAEVGKQGHNPIGAKGGGLATLKVWIDCHATESDRPHLERSSLLEALLRCGLCRVEDLDLRIRYKNYYHGIRILVTAGRLTDLERKVRDVWISQHPKDDALVPGEKLSARLVSENM